MSLMSRVFFNWPPTHTTDEKQRKWFGAKGARMCLCVCAYLRSTLGFLFLYFVYFKVYIFNWACDFSFEWTYTLWLVGIFFVVICLLIYSLFRESDNTVIFFFLGSNILKPVINLFLRSAWSQRARIHIQIKPKVISIPMPNAYANKNTACIIAVADSRMQSHWIRFKMLCARKYKTIENGCRRTRLLCISSHIHCTSDCHKVLLLHNRMYI